MLKNKGVSITNPPKEVLKGVKNIRIGLLIRGGPVTLFPSKTPENELFSQVFATKFVCLYRS